MITVLRQFLAKLTRNPIYKYPLLPPKLQEGARGYVTFSREQLYSIWKQAGGYVQIPLHPMAFSLSYIVLEKDFMHTILKQFHSYHVAATGMPPQELYQEGVFVCVEFAKHACDYVDLCHRLYWKKSVGKHKPGLAWATNWMGQWNERIPDNHALLIVAEMKDDGRIGLGLWEPQLESIYAKYQGEPRGSQLYCCVWP